MNYEELYDELQGLEKELKEKLASAQKLYKAILKETENGDVKSLSKDVQTLIETCENQGEVLKRLQAAVEGFDTEAYFENGEFASQMLDYCKENGVDVKGEYPVYEMFPYRVKFDTENQDIYLDRKKVQCMRPLSFVQTVKKGQDRLMKATFNAQTFVNELADAYDLALAKMKKAPESDIYLTSLYKYLVPMGRFRRDYDQQSFAFDLARLYSSDVETTKGGYRFQFGPSRNNGKALRFLDREGHEHYMATIRFYNE